MKGFEKELEALINKHSIESESNTPDWILAQYLRSCLAAFTTATQQRETWYGRDPKTLSNSVEVEMTKQEEIRQWIESILVGSPDNDSPEKLSIEILTYLHSQGIKLPDGSSLIAEQGGGDEQAI